MIAMLALHHLDYRQRLPLGQGWLHLLLVGPRQAAFRIGARQRPRERARRFFAMLGIFVA